MKKKIIIVTCVVAIAFLIGLGLYKRYFQFNAQDVRDYINEEANKYPEDKRLAVFKQINDGVKDILTDLQLSRQVLRAAQMNGTPREMELVHAAIMQTKGYGYIK